ncbi:MAG: hypothetical protein IJN76_04065 [Clostridia bacterium]|nr:hypothetical protein [Clostridia bacterium]
MDKRKGFLNITVSILCQVLTMVTAILVKRILIDQCGNDVNGLNTLYLSIVGFLSIAELGVGSAISFCMYKPIVEGNVAYTAALYRLFRSVYLGIGGVIWVIGLGITPFVHHFVKYYQLMDVDLHFTFMLMLLSVVITYWYGPKMSLINAHKNNYITSAITSGGTILQSVLQIAVLLLTHSFVWYLVCRIVSNLCQGIVVTAIARKQHSNILCHKADLSILDRFEIIKNIKAMFMHKVGTLLVNSADNIIISIYIGANALGSYSNYNTILVSVTNLMALMFTSLTSVLGHLYAESGKDTTKRYSDLFHVLNFCLGCVIYLGFYAIINDLVMLLFGAEMLSATIVFVITFNAFVQFMRKSVLAFRDATGTFYNDRWKPAIEGVINVILSIAFVEIGWGIAGVLAATVITNLLICHIIEPYVLYKHAFDTTPKKYYMTNYGLIGLFFVALAVLHGCMQDTNNLLGDLFTNGFISVGISAAVCVPVILLSKTARQTLLQKLKGRKRYATKD